MIEFKATHLAPIKLGHTGETDAVRVAFSLAPFEEAFPGGRPALLVRRKGDTQAYPVTLTVEGDTAYWTVTAADTSAAGFGQCELQWYAGDTLAKSDKFDFLVVQALEAGAEPPDVPSKRWFDAIQSQLGDLNDLTTKAKTNLVAAINEAARTGSGGAGSIDMQVSGGYIQYSTDGGATWENLIAVADLKGEPGEDGAPGKPGADGYSPTAKVEETADGAKITITDKAGTTEATVKNGKDGADGAPGKDGTPGSDGYSPEASVTPINGGAKIIIKDKNGTSSANVMNGSNGLPGHTPEITAEKSGKITTIKADGTAIAEISDGSDGAPGKDGAGMDITGAAAGQIAKISAVDENGKPTAWEPVDMPSGGGRNDKAWENWATITVPDGGITALDISTLESGETLAEKDVKEIFIFSPNVSNSGEQNGSATLLINNTFLIGLGIFTRTAAGMLKLWIAIEDGYLYVRYGRRDNDWSVMIPRGGFAFTNSAEDTITNINVGEVAIGSVGIGNPPCTVSKIDSVKIQCPTGISSAVSFEVKIKQF